MWKWYYTQGGNRYVNQYADYAAMIEGVAATFRQADEYPDMYWGLETYAFLSPEGERHGADAFAQDIAAATQRQEAAERAHVVPPSPKEAYDGQEWIQFQGFER